MTAFGIGSNLTVARTYTYTPYDVPDKITLTQSGQWMEFGFTGNGQRAFERDGTGATPSRITYYAGPGFFEQDNTIASGQANVDEVREYLTTPAGTVGVVITTGATAVTKYYLQDHLGSNIAAVNETGGGISRNSYDVWGVRTTTTGVWDNGDRGYTGHEHLNFGLIHMNGRVYDPRWGRFLQADPIIQSPYDLQNYNRYSYVMNNPLSFTDPTGFSRWTNFRDRYGKAIGAVVAAWFIGPWAAELAGNAFASAGTFGFTQSGAMAATAAGNVVGGAAAGFAAGGISGGNLNSALSGAVGGGLFGAAGAYTTAGTVESYAADAAAGCVSSSATGSSCSSGAAGAVAGKLVTNLTVAELGKSPAAQFAGAVIGGGAGSKAAGGSFENGAFSAGMGYILNLTLPLFNVSLNKASYAASFG